LGIEIHELHADHERADGRWERAAEAERRADRARARLVGDMRNASAD
jgi:hypothetical protein